MRIKITTLPKEWLWCETWCPLEDFDSAKIIDFCLDVIKREPKIRSAIRLDSTY